MRGQLGRRIAASRDRDGLAPAEYPTPRRREGDYFEACNCDVSCNCIYLGPATKESCEAFLAWHIRRGEKDGVDLAGLNVALAVRSSKQMTEGGWKVALYLDARAKPEQAKALGAIFSGQAGGYLANVAPLIGEVTGVHNATIWFEKRDGKGQLRIGDSLEMQVEELKGGDGEGPIVISNALLGAVLQPLRQGRADRVRYNGPWRSELAGTNSFLTDFRYEA